MEPLYRRTMQGKRVLYKEYAPTQEQIADMQIEPAEVVTLLTTLTISMLMGIEKQLPPHARIARETKILEQAILRYSSLNASKLCPDLVTVGVYAWGEATRAIVDGIVRTRALSCNCEN